MSPWQQHSKCHSFSFVRYISSAKFEEHCSNISGDILDSVFYCLGGTICDVICSPFAYYKNALNISKTKKKIFQK